MAEQSKFHTTEETPFGGKARGLQLLQNLGYKVPAWMVISHVECEGLNESNRRNDLELRLAKYFGKDSRNQSYAVRSSADDEDGVTASFAGLYQSFLNVPFNSLVDQIQAVWNSGKSEQLSVYRRQLGLPQNSSMHVIVQVMVEPEISGVAFGLDPVTNDSDTKVISAVFGLGQRLVSGQSTADTFRVKKGKIISDIANKTTKEVMAADGALQTIDLDAGEWDKPCLSHSQIKEIATVLDDLGNKLGAAQDVEFCYVGNQLYLLQTRPVTVQNSSPQGDYIVWDNSNIVESYPGVTTPLTFTFIRKMYAQAYKQFMVLMGLRTKEVEAQQELFNNTLGLVRGRVYYNLLTWYKMLAMLPGYAINAPYMETMMGVKEKFELREDLRMAKGLARYRMLVMVLRMIYLQFTLPGKRRKFLRHFDATMARYEALDLGELSSVELAGHYRRFEQRLLLRWQAPLVNDFFAMIWFGMLRKQVIKYCPDEPNLYNDLLSGSRDIISVDPILESLRLTRIIADQPEIAEVFRSTPSHEIWSMLEKGKLPQISTEIRNYLKRYGDRCVGELKLETISYSQDPSLFIKVLQSYLTSGILQMYHSSTGEDHPRIAAEEKLKSALRGNPLGRWWLKIVLKQARDLVSNRENLRFARTRGFGMVRKLMNALGQRLKEEGQLQDARDIFWLELPEIENLSKAVLPPSLREKIEERKRLFREYDNQKDPAERFYTYGMDFSDNYIYSLEKLEAVGPSMQGVGCCPGIVTSKVVVVRNADMVNSIEGNILVTTSTDPGWVKLFPSCSGILVERGSLLSHTAIVSREMGIPCIVGITGLLQALKTGDEVWMNGTTGQITRIE